MRGERTGRRRVVGALQPRGLRRQGRGLCGAARTSRDRRAWARHEAQSSRWSRSRSCSRPSEAARRRVSDACAAGRGSRRAHVGCESRRCGLGRGNWCGCGCGCTRHQSIECIAEIDSIIAEARHGDATRRDQMSRRRLEEDGAAIAGRLLAHSLPCGWMRRQAKRQLRARRWQLLKEGENDCVLVDVDQSMWRCVSHRIPEAARDQSRCESEAKWQCTASCSPQHRIVSHLIALHCIALHSIPSHSIALHCTPIGCLRIGPFPLGANTAPAEPTIHHTRTSPRLPLVCHHRK